jgi:hypothetical protein
MDRCPAIFLYPTKTSGLPTFHHPKLEVCYSISKSSLLHCNFLNEDLVAKAPLFLVNTEFSETLDFEVPYSGFRAADICMFVPTRKTFFPCRKGAFL